MDQPEYSDRASSSSSSRSVVRYSNQDVWYALHAPVSHTQHVSPTEGSRERSETGSLEPQPVPLQDEGLCQHRGRTVFKRKPNDIPLRAGPPRNARARFDRRSPMLRSRTPERSDLTAETFKICEPEHSRDADLAIPGFPSDTAYSWFMSDLCKKGTGSVSLNYLDGWNSPKIDSGRVQSRAWDYSCFWKSASSFISDEIAQDYNDCASVAQVCDFLCCNKIEDESTRAKREETFAKRPIRYGRAARACATIIPEKEWIKELEVKTPTEMKARLDQLHHLQRLPFHQLSRVPQKEIQQAVEAMEAKLQEAKLRGLNVSHKERESFFQKPMPPARTA